VRLSCLARNGRSPGEESLTAAIAVQAIEAQPAFGQIKPMRGQVLACAEQHLGDVPASDWLTQEAPRSRRRKRKPGVQKGGPVVTGRATAPEVRPPQSAASFRCTTQCLVTCGLTFVPLRRRDVGLGEPPARMAAHENALRSRIGPKITMRSYGSAGTGLFRPLVA
jgi:hypothetical protein